MRTEVPFSATKWRATAVVAAISILFSVIAVMSAHPALAGGMTLTIDRWDRDSQSGLVSYDLTLDVTGAAAASQPCESWCTWAVQMKYLDGSIEVARGSLGAGQAGWTNDFTKRLQAEDAPMAEVTHVRATLTPDYGAARQTYTTTWSQVSLPYPDGSIGLDLHEWDRGADERTVTYDMTVAWSGAAQSDGPCVRYCRWRVEAFNDSVYVGGLGGGTIYANRTWRGSGSL